MFIEQKIWDKQQGWHTVGNGKLDTPAQIVFVFGDIELVQNTDILSDISKSYPDSQIVGCSTAGEIIEETVLDQTVVVTAVSFEHTSIRTVCMDIESMSDSMVMGERLAQALPVDGLSHVFVLSNGLNVNGSALARGLANRLPRNVAVTGGLAGDRDNFKNTVVIFDANVRSKGIIVVGFYGTKLKLGYGSMGGWSSFGIDRVVTRSEGNVLYELDGQNALDLYKMYLGDMASGLPATGLLFPLSIRIDNGKSHLVRTIMGINESDGSLTFAGDIPQGSYVRLMKAGLEQLVEGASGAANICSQTMGMIPQFAILISCVGRKLVMKQRIEEEVEAIREQFGEKIPVTGFYSYGEICPAVVHQKQCEFHNQTMTITAFSEK